MALIHSLNHRGLLVESAYSTIRRIEVDRFLKTVSMRVCVFSDEATRRTYPDEPLAEQDYTIHDTPERSHTEIEYDEDKKPVETKVVDQEASTAGSDAVAAYKSGVSLDEVCYLHLKARPEFEGAKDA